MTGSPNADLEQQALMNFKVRIAQLEADLAYFQARIELIGKPRTVNQAAAQRVFKQLHKAIGAALVTSRKRLLDDSRRRSE